MSLFVKVQSVEFRRKAKISRDTCVKLPKKYIVAGTVAHQMLITLRHGCDWTPAGALKEKKWSEVPFFCESFKCSSSCRSHEPDSETATASRGRPVFLRQDCGCDFKPGFHPLVAELLQQGGSVWTPRTRPRMSWHTQEWLFDLGGKWKRRVKQD